MAVFGYIFLAEEKESLVSAEVQQQALLEYAQSLGSIFTQMYVEENSPLQRPFKERPAGEELLSRCGFNDSIITMKAEWILGSAVEGDRLLRLLTASQVALHCVDLGVNISVPEKRRLVVSEGSAELVKKLLSALSVCENSRHSESIRMVKQLSGEKRKYLGGPVPFGWEVNSEGFLVENEAQQRIIGKIAAMRTERWSYRQISGRLRDEFDIRLSHEGVRKILAGNSNREMQEM